MRGARQGLGSVRAGARPDHRRVRGVRPRRAAAPWPAAGRHGQSAVEPGYSPDASAGAELACYFGELGPCIFGQRFRSMAAPTRELEKLIVSKKLAHGGNPVPRWMAANVAVAQYGIGNLKPAKDKSTQRITFGGPKRRYGCSESVAERRPAPQDH
jgi:Phage Terminase